MRRFSVLCLQMLLAITFIVIPISRICGAFTLQQVLSLGVPPWLIWVANVIEAGGAILLLLGIRTGLLAVSGALLLAVSMLGATLAHVRAGNLFAELPWTLVFLGLSLIVVLLHWSAVQAVLSVCKDHRNMSIEEKNNDDWRTRGTDYGSRFRDWAGNRRVAHHPWLPRLWDKS